MLRVEITSDGILWNLLEEVSTAEGAWTDVSFDLCGDYPPAEAMVLRITACDSNGDHVLEAAIDDVLLEGASSG